MYGNIEKKKKGTLFFFFFAVGSETSCLEERPTITTQNSELLLLRTTERKRHFEKRYSPIEHKTWKRAYEGFNKNVFFGYKLHYYRRQTNESKEK